MLSSSKVVHALTSTFCSFLLNYQKKYKYKKKIGWPEQMFPTILLGGTYK
jgi:hypothetical protein